MQGCVRPTVDDNSDKRITVRAVARKQIIISCGSDHFWRRQIIARIVNKTGNRET